MFPVLFILLCPFPPAACGSIQYVSYQPAVNIIYTSSGGSSPPQRQGGGAAVPFSPAIPPNCPSGTQSCSSIGEPSWCCTTAQHCAFDDAGDVACCPVGDFCRGVVEYGTAPGGGSGSGTGTGGGSAGGGDGGSGAGSETTPDAWSLPGISNGNGGVTITSGAAVTGRSNPMQQCCTKPLMLLLLGMGLGLWSMVMQEGF